MIDRALATKLGFHRDDRHAIGFDAAIAAAFAHQFIDHDAFGRIGEGAALATAALLGRAGLVVDHDRSAFDFPQRALHGVEFIAVIHHHARRQPGLNFGDLILFRFIGHHHHFFHAFRMHLLGNHRHADRAVYRLAASHGDRVVEENFVGDIDATGNGRANRQQARVVVSTVAQVGKDVLHFGEWLNAHPRHALAAHLREGHGHFRPDPGRHVVAADTRQCFGTFRHFGRGVVRAARAERRDARNLGAWPLQRSFLVFDELEARLDNLAGVELGNAFGDHARDHRRGQFAGRRQQPVATRHFPFAVIIVFADHARAYVVAPVVELFFHLIFDELALFLHHQDFLQPHGEFPYGGRLQRPGHAHLHQANADLGRMALVDPQVFECLQYIEIALARGNDAEPRRFARRGRIDGDVVQFINPAVRECGINLRLLQP